MQYEFGAKSDVGNVRANNEDSYKIAQNFAIVADGMGGHKKGEVASALAVEIVSDFISDKKCSIVQAIDAANKEIYKKSQKSDYLGMGTTVVMCLMEGDKAVFANVGDSRGYLFSQGKLVQVTKDHSLVQKLIDDGEITESEAEKREDKSVILRAVGADKDVTVDVFEKDIMSGDIIMLCSDGLSNCVKADEIALILNCEDSLQKKAEKLVETANNNGGYDNITVVLLKNC